MTQKTKKAKEKIYGNRIREILMSLEMTQKELADIALNGDAALLSKIINGQRRCISLPIAFKIANGLNMKVEQVFIHSKPQTTQNENNQEDN